MNKYIFLLIFGLCASVDSSLAVIMGNGTEAEPYLIQSLADFDEFTIDSAYWAKGIRTKLMCDIDLVGRTYTTAVITQNGNSSFSGVFDGHNHIIFNLTIDDQSTENLFLGLFGRLEEDAELKNLGIKNYTITGRDLSYHLGGLVGVNDGCITNCFIVGAVTGKKYAVGGLCGRNSGIISNCYTTSSVIGDGDSVGGLVGYNSGIINNCHATGDVAGKAKQVGGLCGENRKVIQYCYATNYVTGSIFVGGLVAVNYNNATVSNCYANGIVSGDNNAGGLVAYNNISTIYNCYASGNVTGQDYVGGFVAYNRKGNINFCYAIGNVTGEKNVGGLCGGNDDGFIKECFWDKEISGMTEGIGSTNGGIITNVFGRTTKEMKTQSNFTDFGWDFIGEEENGIKEIWLIQENNYPGFAWHVLSGNGTENDPYLIESLNDFDVFAGNSVFWMSGIYTKLRCDIDLAHRTYTAAVIAPDTVNSNHSNYPFFDGIVFEGVFEGNGNQIANITINDDGVGNDYLGLFGHIRPRGKVKNLDIVNYSILGGTYSYCLGGLCGSNGGIIQNCSTTGSLAGGGHSHSLGGVCGSNGGIISNCYATGSVTGKESLGGLCGNNGGTVSNCYAGVSVTGRTSIGGLVGRNWCGTIGNCYATGDVVGTLYNTGGLVGENEDSIIKNCYAVGHVTGMLYIGGLLGSNNYSIISNIENCFWDVETSEMVTGIGHNLSNAINVFGKSTAEMQTQGTFTDYGWNFLTPVWIMCSEGVYPTLWWLGCNTTPVANAGGDQTVFGCVGGVAEIKLDGSGSYDADGDELDYFWFEGVEQIATGVDPNVQLSVGQHTIELIVNDGTEDSEPNTVVITVIGPVEADVDIVPRVINRNNRMKRVMAIIRLPEGIGKGDVVRESFELYAGGLDGEPVGAILERVIGRGNMTRVFVLFDKEEVMGAVEGVVGGVELTVVGRLESGQYISGSDTVRIVKPRRRRPHWQAGRRRQWKR